MDGYNVEAPARDLIALLETGDLHSGAVQELASQVSEQLQACEAKNSPAAAYARQAAYNVAWLIPNKASEIVEDAIIRADELRESGCDAVSWRDLVAQPTGGQIVASLANLLDRLPGSTVIVSGMTPKLLAKRLDVIDDTLRSYAKGAGVEMPEGKGHSNFVYEHDAIEKICEWVIATGRRASEHASALLAEIRTKSENPN